MPAGKVLWEPDSRVIKKSNITAYMRWLEKRRGSFEDYGELWKWSVEDIEGFWTSIWRYFDVSDVDYFPLRERKMPGAKWFDGAELNFVEKLFRERRDSVAILSKTERGSQRKMVWGELERKASAFASRLRELGVVPGDRVAAYLSNTLEAVVGLLGTAMVGGIWSCCSPDFGAPAVVDRFGQIRPRVLLVTDGYSYGGKWFDRTDVARQVAKALPTVDHVVSVPATTKGNPFEGTIEWGDASGGKAKAEYAQVPFDHPLWILYSSGTTGLPKPIVHGHGGILLEHLKVVGLQNDIGPSDRFFWFTTTGWMMWNYLVGGLLHGGTIVLYNGSAGQPDMGALWDLVEETGTTFMGLSAAYIGACMKSGIEPRSTHTLKPLRGIGSTGSPLSPKGFEWVYANVKDDLWLSSICGGTDVCTAFIGGSPTLPVHSGEIQCRCLGAKVEAFDENGAPVVDQLGELVVTEPMPSMPLFFWGDEDGTRYLQSYFETFPGVWRHGDWIEITRRGTCIIYGRSDATIKRMGVRIGTSEIYRAMETVPEVRDSLAISVDKADRQSMILFVTLAEGTVLDEGLVGRIKEKVKTDLSPKYVPDEVVAVPEFPQTLNGKKLEVPVRKVFMGIEPSMAVNLDTLANPGTMEYFVGLAKAWKEGKKL